MGAVLKTGGLIEERSGDGEVPRRELKKGKQKLLPNY